MGAASTLSRLLMVAAPGLFQSALYPVERLHLPVLGLSLLLTGPLLVYATLVPGLRRRQEWAAHLVAGAAFLAFGLFMALPGRAWTGLALYCGVGRMVGVLHLYCVPQ